MRKTVLLVALVLMVAAAAPADGGGGMFYGYQVAAYPFLENYPVRNNSLGLAYFGGYGYGVNRRSNWVTGGFGFAMLDVHSDTGVAGGFGGVISGYRFLAAPINISILSWTGFGGISVGAFDPDGPGGYFAVSEEITLEIGLPILPWFMPTVYVGYQFAGNVIPGQAFQSFVSYTPVAGLRVQWGDFDQSDGYSAPPGRPWPVAPTSLRSLPPRCSINYLQIVVPILLELPIEADCSL